MEARNGDLVKGDPLNEGHTRDPLNVGHTKDHVSEHRGNDRTKGARVATRYSNNMEHLLVTGSREWKDLDTIERELSKHSVENTILVHGGCRGADLMAESIWKKMGGQSISCPVTKEDWEKWGKRAGLLRNKSMLKDYPIKKALAFCLHGSNGTMHMVSLLNKAKIPVVIDYRI